MCYNGCNHEYYRANDCYCSKKSKCALDEAAEIEYDECNDADDRIKEQKEND